MDPRHPWAMEALELGGDERVLEVGCGPGVTATLVCERLRGGSLLAIDRSAKAVAQAGRRLRACDRAELRVGVPEDLDERFDRVFSMNVRELWEAPERVTRLLAPGGLAVWVFQLPSWTAADAEARIAPLAQSLGAGAESLVGAPAFAVRWRPPHPHGP
jgi:trans-aconitate methyltransferase